MKRTKLDPDDKVNLFLVELETWIDLQKSGALRNLFTILKNHEDYCKKEALRLLKNQEDRKADCMRAIGDDANKIIELIRNRIKELEKGVKKNG